jgi:hypothetical protein
VTLTSAIVFGAYLVPLPPLALLTGVGGIALSLFGLRHLHQQRRRRQPHASQIGKALTGPAELHGVAQGENTITSALTAQPCYYYRAIAWQPGPGRNRVWQKVAEETELVPFWLDDMTGRVEVNAHGAEMDLLRDFHEEYGPATLHTQTDLPQGVTAFLARHNVATDKSVRIEEYRISPQSPLFICGTLTQKEEVSPQNHTGSVSLSSAPQDQPEVVYLSVAPVGQPASAMSMQSRVAAALNRASAQKPAAWEVATPLPHFRRDAPAQQPKSAPVFIISRGEDESPLVISWRSPNLVARKAAWPIGVLALGVLMFLVSAYLLLGRHGH